MPLSNLVIHNEINTENIEKKFIECLQKRKVPAKFSYWSENGSKKWNFVIQDRSYMYYRQESSLLKKTIGNISTSVFGEKKDIYNIINLGMGNKEKSAMVIKECLKKNKINYFPFDMSEDMIRQEMSQLSPSLVDSIENMEAYVADLNDFESISMRIRKKYFSQHFILFLGNTMGELGNLNTFGRIIAGMGKKDYLLMGVMLYKKETTQKEMHRIDKLIDMYSTSSFQKFIFTSLEHVGFAPSDGTIEVEYSPNKLYPKLMSMEVFFCLNRDKRIVYSNHELPFLKESKIRIFQTYLYPEDTIMDIFNMFNLKVVQKYTSSNNISGLFLCQLM